MKKVKRKRTGKEEKKKKKKLLAIRFEDEKIHFRFCLPPG